MSIVPQTFCFVVNVPFSLASFKVVFAHHHHSNLIRENILLNRDVLNIYPHMYAGVSLANSTLQKTLHMKIST